jgi:probable HAF family extracellular repeat protein
MIDIGTFGGTCGVANALNNLGQVVGQSYLPGNMTAHAFLWDKGHNSSLTDLGTLGGDNSSALWLNDAGEVVGYADLPPGSQSCSGQACVHHAFLWKLGVMTDLGTIGTDPCSRAVSINSRGQVVGFTASICGGNGSGHGFLWQNGGPAIDLNTLVAPGSGLTVNSATYINDRGEIAGTGVLASGDVHAFLLIPCAEDNQGCGNGTAAQPTEIGSDIANVTQRPPRAILQMQALSDGSAGRLNLLNSRTRLGHYLLNPATEQ